MGRPFVYNAVLWLFIVYVCCVVARRPRPGSDYSKVLVKSLAFSVGPDTDDNETVLQYIGPAPPGQRAFKRQKGEPIGSFHSRLRECKKKRGKWNGGDKEKWNSNSGRGTDRNKNKHDVNVNKQATAVDESNTNKAGNRIPWLWNPNRGWSVDGQESESNVVKDRDQTKQTFDSDTNKNDRHKDKSRQGHTEDTPYDENNKDNPNQWNQLNTWKADVVTDIRATKKDPEQGNGNKPKHWRPWKTDETKNENKDKTKPDKGDKPYKPKPWQQEQKEEDDDAVDDTHTESDDTAGDVDVDVEVDAESSKTDSKAVPAAKIVGGTLASHFDWHWIVSIQYLGEDLYWYHFCGGSLIDEQWVVSAAHCVLSLEDLTIRVMLGVYHLRHPSYSEQAINPSNIYMHAYYDNTSYHYDIAMVKLEYVPTFNNHVQIIELATPDIDVSDYHDRCFISGWDNSAVNLEELYLNDGLQQSKMTVLSTDECRLVYGDDIVQSQICIQSGVASACSGDSGGPLMCSVDKSWRLMGVASWVGSHTCSPTFPNVYTRMSYYHTWLINVMLTYQ